MFSIKEGYSESQVHGILMITETSVVTRHLVEGLLIEIKESEKFLG